MNVRRHFVASACFVGAGLAHESALSADPVVYTLGEGERVHGRTEARASGERSAVELEALRGETVSFQVVVEGTDANPLDVSVQLPWLEGRTELLPVDAFVEHFVDVASRSRAADEPMSSLGWAPASRPPDDDVLGMLPDALIPVRLAACPPGGSRTFCPYPLHVGNSARRAMWFDVFVPLDATPGTFAGRALLMSEGRSLSAVDVSLRVLPARLPDAAVSVFAYYAFDTLEGSFTDAPRAERSVWTTLHAHHVDAVTALTREADAVRVGDALSGALFTSSRAYRGPGEGRPPEVVPIGAYGSLGDPTEASVRTALAISGAIAPENRDVFLYAVDEQCKSPRGADWKRALDGQLPIGWTCADDPRGQDVDVVMMPADAFRSDAARAARAAGKRVFVYNGRLPFAGPMMLDAPVTGLTGDGWIAASYDIGRWFFWETTFWNDNNRGGKGPRDPFADTETFHNADGDACLGDGLLLYPGRLASWPEHSLEADGVLPSMRLKALRRGVEDAGLLALAASVDPAKALEIDERVIAGALDDVRADERVAMRLDAPTLARARAELRSVIGSRDISLPNAKARAILGELQAARRRRRSIVPERLRGSFLLLAPAVLFALGFAIAAVGLPRLAWKKRTARG